MLVSMAALGTLAAGVAAIDRCAVPKPPPAPPVPPPPPLKPKTYSNGPYTLDETHGVEWSFNVLPDSSWEMQLSASNVSGTGWLGFGWSPDGKMQMGDFVIGYSGCVRVTSLGSGSPPPNGPGGFGVTGAGFYQNGTTRILRFKRPYKTSIPGHVGICTQGEPDCTPPAKYFVLFAAGSNAPSDPSCNTPFSSTMYHNQFAGSHEINSSLVSAAAAAGGAPAHSVERRGPDDGSSSGGAQQSPLVRRKERTKPPPADIWRMHTPISFSESHTTSRPHPTLPEVTVLSTTYFSTPIPLASGEIAWTYPEVTPIAMPGGRKHAVLGVRNSEVVDCYNNSVPLSEVYNHHWIFNPVPTHENKACPNTGLNFVVGVGAESRNTPTEYPKGHGFIVEKDWTWNANIHLLRTTELAGGPGAAKECIECWWGPKKTCTPDGNGTFACCYSDSSCETAPNANTTQTVYYLKYTVVYTFEWELVTPVDVAIIMAPECSIEYNAIPAESPNAGQGYPSAAPPGPEHLVVQGFTAPANIELVWATAHFHTGAINASLVVNGEVACTSMPVYGTEHNVAGNELGYLVKVTQCIGDQAPAGTGRTAPLRVSKGDKVEVHGWYYVGDDDKRIAPTPGGPHLVVMSYMITAYRAVLSDEHLGLDSA